VPRRLFALDQNFPEPIVNALAEFLEEDAELIPIRVIDARLPTADDWQVLQALYVHERPLDGLITTDRNMLGLPKELSVLCQTKLTLVVARAVGHDPIKATGLLLAHLAAICDQTDRQRAQLWTLRTTKKPPDDLWSYMTAAAKRQKMSARDLYQRERLAGGDLSRDLLGQRVAPE
jgi:hypothetical protein